MGVSMTTDVRSAIFKLSAPFPDMLHSHYVIIAHHYQLVVILGGRKLFRK
jgi:hypothetical protein